MTDFSDAETAAATPVLPPLLIADDGECAETCDLLVVGCGAAGVAAALEAAERGLDVIVVDRFSGGGASAMSGGIVYAGGGTRVQKECGIEDTPEKMARYLAFEADDAVSPRIVEQFCEDSPALIDWLERHGAQFGGPLAKRKASYPPPGTFLYFSGNETLQQCTRATPAVPRGHRAKPSGDIRRASPLTGHHLMGALLHSLRSNPRIRLITQCAARRLLVLADGRVAGAQVWGVPAGSLAAKRHRFLGRLSNSIALQLLGVARWALGSMVRIERKHAKPCYIRARRGVLLSTGGFIHNREMLRRAAPKYLGVVPLGTPGCDGSAVRLGQSVGADCRFIDSISAWRFINPPYDWMKGVIVGLDGARLTNEEQYGARIGRALFEYSGGRGWLVIDKKIYDTVAQELESGQISPHYRPTIRLLLRGSARADNLAELADRMHIPARALEETLRAYNEMASGSGSDPLGKSREFCVPLSTPPFWAIDISCTSRINPLFGITLGGLRVDQESGAVLRADGTQVGGLYAAGRSAAGLPSRNYVSGLSLADCFWTGRRAAAAIARGSEMAAQHSAASHGQALVDHDLSAVEPD